MNQIEIAKEKVQPIWQSLEKTFVANQAKVLRAFQDNKASSYCFTESTGYGYNDQGRDLIEAIYKQVFQTEAALVRPQIVSGTHAINLCLSILEPGNQLVSISGAPYDTLQQVIGTHGNARRSLINRGIEYQEVSLDEDGKLDWDGILAAITQDTSMVMLQRSRGYSWRPSIPVSEIARAVELVRSKNKNCIIFVDNCYGEFVERLEPTDVGVDLMAGSLIKNPGGSMAPSGGYIVGKQDLVEECAQCLTAPGLGSEVGPTFGLTRPLLQGFFNAPHVVGQAVRGAILTAQVFQDLGYPVTPTPKEHRTDIIQAIELNSRDQLINFCWGIQKASPIDSQYKPVPDAMPGYDNEIIMAAGTFIQGASIELSADAPLREPYIVYLQGGTAIEHVQLALESVLQEI